jgi:hypothetical protein
MITASAFFTCSFYPKVIRSIDANHRLRQNSAHPLELIMFCTSCGNAIVPGQAVCSKCGTPTSAGVMQGVTGVNRVAQHYRTLGILTIIYSFFWVIGGAGMLFAARFIFGGVIGNMNPPPPAFVAPLINVLGWIVLTKGILGVVAGIGLLAREPWARVLTLIVAFVSLIDIPFGTAIGAYSIWVLLAAGSEHDYQTLCYAGH